MAWSCLEVSVTFALQKAYLLPFRVTLAAVGQLCIRVYCQGLWLPALIQDGMFFVDNMLWFFCCFKLAFKEGA